MRRGFVMLLCLLGLALVGCNKETANTPAPKGPSSNPADTDADVRQTADGLGKALEQLTVDEATELARHLADKAANTNEAKEDSDEGEDEEDEELIFLESLGFGGHGVIPASVHIQCTNAQCRAVQIKRWNDCNEEELVSLFVIVFPYPDDYWGDGLRPAPPTCDICHSDMGPMRKCRDCKKWYPFDAEKDPLNSDPEDTEKDLICPHCHFNASEAYRQYVAALRENLGNAGKAIEIYKETMAAANRQLDEAEVLIQDNKLDEADAILKELESNTSNMGNDVQKRIKALRQVHTDKKAVVTE